VHNNPSLYTKTSENKNKNATQKVTQTSQQWHLWTET